MGSPGPTIFALGEKVGGEKGEGHEWRERESVSLFPADIVLEIPFLSFLPTDKYLTSMKVLAHRLDLLYI